MPRRAWGRQQSRGSADSPLQEILLVTASPPEAGRSNLHPDLRGQAEPGGPVAGMASPQPETGEDSGAGEGSGGGRWCGGARGAVAVGCLGLAAQTTWPTSWRKRERADEASLPVNIARFSCSTARAGASIFRYDAARPQVSASGVGFDLHGGVAIRERPFHLAVGTQRQPLVQGRLVSDPGASETGGRVIRQGLLNLASLAGTKRPRSRKPSGFLGIAAGIASSASARAFASWPRAA